MKNSELYFYIKWPLLGPGKEYGKAPRRSKDDIHLPSLIHFEPGQVLWLPQGAVVPSI